MATAQILFAEYLTPLLHAAPLDGRLFLTEIGEDDRDDKNDLRFLIVWDANVTGLTKEKVTLSDGSEVLSFRGKNSVYEVIVRPLGTILDGESIFAGELTLTIEADAVTEGNTEISETWSYSDTVPEAAWQDVFTTEKTYQSIVAVTRDRVILLNGNDLDFFTYDGELQSGEQVTIPDSISSIDKVVRYANQKYLVLADHTLYLVDARGWIDWQSAENIWLLDSDHIESIAVDAVNRRLFVSGGMAVGTVPMDTLHGAIQSGDDLLDIEFSGFTLSNGDVEVSEWTQLLRLATDKGNLYIATSEDSDDNFIYPYAEDGLLNGSGRLLLPAGSSDERNTRSIFVFENHLYRYSQTKFLRRVDLSTVRAPKPKSEIYPIQVTPSQRIDLRKYIRDANDIVFDVGFDLPDWLSLKENRYLEVSSDVAPESSAFVRLRGINQNGVTTENGFGFYVFVPRLQTPQWKDFDALNMFLDQSLNMFAYVENADKINWQHGFTVPTDIELSDGKIQITGDAYATPNTLKLRASTRRAGTFADITFTLNIVSNTSNPDLATHPFRFRTLVEDIDITRYVRETSEINNSLDIIKVNAFKRGEATVNLSDENGFFNSDLDDNFWETNDLNRNGYLNKIVIFVNYLQENGTWGDPEVFFEGVILKWNESIKGIQVTLGCVDVSYYLRQTQLDGAGVGKPMLGVLSSPEDTEPSLINAGVYMPENSVIPLNVEKNAIARLHTDPIQLKDVQNRFEGVDIDNTGFLSESDLKTQSGFIDDTIADVLLRFRTAYRRKAAHAVAEILTKIDRIYSVETDFEATAESEHISSNGNIAFNTVDGRILRYPVDWLHDDTNDRLYVLLSNRSDGIGDQLMVYHIKGDRYEILNEFDPDIAIHQLATSDFVDFYILTTPAIGNEIDRSAETPDVDTDSVALGYADTTEILKYQQDVRRTTTVVAADDAYPPQVGLHYYVGFESEDSLWRGIQPSSRPAFRIQSGELYYRFATDTELGVAKLATDGSTAEVIAADRDVYQNHLNFAFDIDADGEVFMAYSNGTPEDSTLIIENTSETVVTRRALVYNLTELDTIGGAWLGVNEILVYNGFCYLIVPVARNNRDVEKSAGVVLYRYGLETLQLEALDSGDFIHYGPTSLVLHNEAVYFVESPAVSYKLSPRNSALPSWDTETAQNLLPDAKGFLKKIEPSGEITSHGNIWFDAHAFRGTPMKVLSFNDALHIVICDGDPETIEKHESRVSQPTSFQWLTFGKRLNYRVDIPTAGSVYDALVDIATKTDATFSIEKNIVRIRNRKATGALIDGDLSATADSVSYDNANKAFGASGYLLIEKEILQYTARTETQLTGVVRGVSGAAAAAHDDNTEILQLQSVLTKDDINGDINIGLHWYQLYNTFVDAQRNINLVDEESRTQFGQRQLDVDLGLTQHDIAWIEFVANEYLQRFKDVRHLLRIQLKPVFHLRLGDIVGFHYAGLTFALRIMEISYGLRSTRIVGRQVTANITPAVEVPMADPNETYRTVSGTGNPILVAGNGDVALFVGNELNLAPKAPAFASGESIGDQNWTQFARVSVLTLPKVEDEGNGDVVYSLSPILDGMFFDPISLKVSGAPQGSQATTEVTYTATDRNGETDSLMFDATVSVVSRESRRTLSGTGDPILVAGNGDVALFKGA